MVFSSGESFAYHVGALHLHFLVDLSQLDPAQCLQAPCYLFDP